MEMALWAEHLRKAGQPEFYPLDTHVEGKSACPVSIIIQLQYTSFKSTSAFPMPRKSACRQVKEWPHQSPGTGSHCPCLVPTLAHS